MQSNCLSVGTRLFSIVTTFGTGVYSVGIQIGQSTLSALKYLSNRISSIWGRLFTRSLSTQIIITDDFSSPLRSRNISQIDAREVADEKRLKFEPVVPLAVEALQIRSAPPLFVPYAIRIDLATEIKSFEVLTLESEEAVMQELVEIVGGGCKTRKSI
jgi:hypothetical protein